mmetsp:Transcript_21473/g.30751  ORF Transcript_21473/g.30751 Transcript_21473/m.30751 type:complete len:272 (+) Transcript_21473:171-986(+)
MTDEMSSSQPTDEEWRVDVRESIVTQDFCSIFGLDAVMNYMSFNHSIIATEGIERFFEKQVHDWTGPKPRFRVAFITNINMAITKGSPEVKQILNGVESLLHTVFRLKSDKTNITRLLTSTARNDDNLYAVVAIFANTIHTKGNGNVEVVNASLGCYECNVGAYLGYLATSQSRYSTSKYGKSADGNEFQRRGLGQLVVSLFQFLVFWKSYRKDKNKVKPIYLHCDRVKREATFLKYGFTTCTKGIPKRAAALQHLLGISSGCIKDLGIIH